jgi:predicted transcriptional regulator
MTEIHTPIDADLKDRLILVAKEDRRSQAAVVAIALEYYFAAREKEREKKGQTQR